MPFVDENDSPGLITGKARLFSKIGGSIRVGCALVMGSTTM